MVKVVTLRCTGCGNTYAFRIGAGEQLATWRDISASVTDAKEEAKILDILTGVSAKRNPIVMNEFMRNPAEVLHHIPYALCGEECVALAETPEEATALLGDKAKESIAASEEKWKAALQKEGILAFEAIYLCPKSRHPKQGLHLQIQWMDEKQKGCRYTYRPKCDECAGQLVLADDGNAGFMHEDMPTVARCESCNAPLVIDKVSFKVPTKEA